MAGGADSAKAVLYALGANFAIAVAKYVAAFITGSGSMLAEAVHSTADCGNQLLLLLGLKRSRMPPTDDYPMGYGKETYFWSFIVAIMLFSIGGLFSLYEGWHKLHETEQLSRPIIALAVLAFGIVAESFSMWGCMREVNKTRGGQSLWSWFRSSRNAELVVIFGEDLAALVGLVLAFVAVLASWMLGDPLWDAVGSMAIGVLLIVVAILVGVEVKALLVGQGVEPRVKQDMCAWLEAQPKVDAVVEMITLHMGSDVMVALKARLGEFPDSAAMATEINRIEAGFRAEFPQVKWTFFEPDVR